MARHGSAMLMTVVASFALLQLVSATSHQVGGAGGWTIPTATNGIDYNTFAAQSFFVGDVLEFKYNKDSHNVISFKTEEAYNGCDVNNIDAITVFEATGITNITLKTAGRKFYACQAGAGTHCNNGQKFTILVAEKLNAGGAVSAPASPPVPEPASGAASSLAVHSTVSVAVVLSAAAMILL